MCACVICVGAVEQNIFRLKFKDTYAFSHSGEDLVNCEMSKLQNKLQTVPVFPRKVTTSCKTKFKVRRADIKRRELMFALSQD